MRKSSSVRPKGDKPSTRVGSAQVPWNFLHRKLLPVLGGSFLVVGGAPEVELTAGERLSSQRWWWAAASPGGKWPSSPEGGWPSLPSLSAVDLQQFIFHNQRGM